MCREMQVRWKRQGRECGRVENKKKRKKKRLDDGNGKERDERKVKGKARMKWVVTTCVKGVSLKRNAGRVVRGMGKRRENGVRVKKRDEKRKVKKKRGIGKGLQKNKGQKEELKRECGKAD